MKVRANSLYYFDPGFMDKMDARVMALFNRGDHVRVINLHGCPPANTMGMCYIVPADAKKNDRGEWDKDFAMVNTASLVKAWSESPAEPDEPVFTKEGEVLLKRLLTEPEDIVVG